VNVEKNHHNIMPIAFCYIILVLQYDWKITLRCMLKARYKQLSVEYKQALLCLNFVALLKLLFFCDNYHCFVSYSCIVIKLSSIGHKHIALM